MDRFATASNALLRKYNSYFHEIETAGVDAFAQKDWEREFNYCNPPFSILGRLTNFLIDIVPLAPCLLVAPYWSGSPWFARLLAFADHAFLLPTDVETFV